MRIPRILRLPALLGPVVFGVSTIEARAAYEIRRGDTLSGIALSRYGTREKWKELFELNRDQIRNPNWIYPGQSLRLLDGESPELVASNSADVPVSKKKKNRSQEWRLLPVQIWEKVQLPPSPHIDSSGFDRRSSIGLRASNRTISPMAISPERIAIIGSIEGSRSNFSQITLGEQVFLRPDEAIQVGTVYSVTTGPESVISSRDGREGFLYKIAGKVKVIGVRDGLFIGTITALYHPIERGNVLIPEVEALTFHDPVPASNAIEASILVPGSAANDLIGQQRLVFLDVGTNEGANAGMIFRQYLHTDPHTGEEISSKDFLIESELQILSAQERFSIAIVLRSRSGVRAGETVVGLTDLRDFDRNQGLQTVIQDRSSAAGMDELDRLDTTDGMGEKESRDLRQLETWSKESPDEEPGESSGNSDVKRELLNPKGNSAAGIGEEAAPNDASGAPASESPPPTAPEQSPEESTNKPTEESPEESTEEPSPPSS